ncbi:MAG: stage II sporulation protein M [Nanoarchaeota archaeon]|nr:stage II sporulation protein M [Nanoarchaeota archaeon]
MVLETIINPINAERKPWEMFFIGIVYSSVAILLSFWIFHEYTSLVMVFLTTMACVPLLYNTIKLEEKKDIVINEERTLLQEHSKVISFLLFLFLGFALSFAAWYVFLPADLAQNAFSVQTQTITNINTGATGMAFQSLGILTKIFFNNIKVLIFCILFAFIYGAGAIFILTWNASVIGAAIGNFVRIGISAEASMLGLMGTAKYFHIFSLGLLRYAIHGIPEIAAYFIGGLAGSIISIAVIRHDLGTKKYEKILLDSSDLVIIAIVVLFLAALLEVYVTPLLF